MGEKKARDITLEVLISIRDEIRGLREDTNSRFEQMDRRFEQMEKRLAKIEGDISQIRQDIGHIVVRFDRDYLILATDLDGVKRRLNVCERHLGIVASQ
jgi:septation ring formation regulator EzrA